MRTATPSWLKDFESLPPGPLPSSRDRWRMSDRRLLKQYFEAWQRAGLTACPEFTAVPRSDPAPAPPAAREAAAKPARNLETGPRPSSLSDRQTQSSSLPADHTAARAPVASAEVMAADNGPPEYYGREWDRAQREQRLAELARCVADCQRCPQLASTRTQTVFGVGDPETRLMFIGEAPGADEDRQGEPFVGRAGQLLNRIIEACQLRREQIYICNVLRCRPPGNRNPSEEEAANCREFLDGQIATVAPDYITCWGSVAAHSLLGVKTPIGKLRGQFYRYGPAKVLCTYHPSYLLRNPSAKKLVWEDMKFLFADMGVPL